MSRQHAEGALSYRLLFGVLAAFLGLLTLAHLLGKAQTPLVGVVSAALILVPNFCITPRFERLLAAGAWFALHRVKLALVWGWSLPSGPKPDSLIHS